MRHCPEASEEIMAEERRRWTAAATGSSMFADRCDTPETGDPVSNIVALA